MALAGANISNAASVAWNAFNDTGVINTGTVSTAAALPIGSWVQIGYFKTLSDATVTADAATVAGTAALAADFYTFGSLQISANGTSTPNSGLGAAGPGGWQQLTNNFSYASNPTFIAGHQAYFWVMNSTNNSSLSAAEASVTQQAIFTLPSWTFPASDISGQKNFDISDLSSASRNMLFGSYISGANNTNLTAAGFASTNNAVQLATVTAAPEPSRALLLGVSFGIFLIRRRRR